MHELPFGNQNENPEKTDLEKLNFEELKKLSVEAVKLARSSFKEIENGFQNINGEKITIMEGEGEYRILDLPNVFHHFILFGSNGKLQKDFNDKEELMQEIRNMIEETGNRIIE